jgi:archaeal preflagellin peptidase FlaK
MEHAGPFLDTVRLVEMLAPHSMTLRYIIGSLVLLYAIWTDLTQRRVANEVWLVTLVIGILFVGYDVLIGNPPLFWLLGAPLVAVFAYSLWRLGLLFGGADAKCVIAFAVLCPYPPALVTIAGVAYPHFGAITPAAITMFTNAVLLTLAIPLFYLIINLARGRLHPVAMFLGTRMKLSRAAEEPVWVMEWVKPSPEAEAGEEGPSLQETTEDPDLSDEGLPQITPEEIEGATVRLHYFPTRAGDYARNLARLKAMGVDEVWVTPKVPFMVPLFLGWLLAWTAGDLVMNLVLWVTGAL